MFRHLSGKPVWGWQKNAAVVTLNMSSRVRSSSLQSRRKSGNPGLVLTVGMCSTAKLKLSFIWRKSHYSDTVFLEKSIRHKNYIQYCKYFSTLALQSCELEGSTDGWSQESCWVFFVKFGIWVKDTQLRICDSNFLLPKEGRIEGLLSTGVAVDHTECCPLDKSSR